ncbi:MAG TPA: hypothetical protein DCQ26_07450 [Marinilabiliales bacterium]|nr:MAG: hypothetical protein A2W84_19400 [Bacteroidetes bacterium GWC2_40_13]OFX71868.1 MAG: hypothetical protein A2W96_06455 [Bacteroidetes bacterium GWD2_40_43]OFX94665.1 MAG: hypothetical protein A2W97_18260 [Bacteroidetes bacterium GWE2_40_63]OFY17967.1 MAG: hypothetical protein A2W88_16395 [Bacteroidetes bacterium GWF2_40_13]OFZ24431.1 MAG: hypothetical protein A2437_18395 [Bacteroidetes bacterium RIFOXYC2_FULL_40_12]HAM98432.1 hypothetical protein [Marinilabiliales bacterium]
MSFEVHLKLEAHQDIFEAILWYESKRDGLGGEFYLEIEKVKNLLRKNPDLFEIKYKNIVRWVQTERFPYIVVFVIDVSKVVILAVVSTHRNPKIWKERI